MALSLTQSPALVEEALALLPSGMVQGRSVSVSDVVTVRAHSDVFRLTLTSHVNTIYLIVKRVSRIEYETHALLFRELPHLVPHVHGAAPILGEPGWLIVMQDYRPLGGAAGLPVDRSTIHRALRALAEIHQTYAKATKRLHALGLKNACADAEGADSMCQRLAAALDVLPTLAQRLPIPLSAGVLARGRGAVEVLKARCTSQPESSQLTLVHGDFHFENILQFGRGGVRLLDWGCAGIQSPAWDLVLCGEREVAFYLSLWAVRPVNFHEALRTAVMCRMAQLVTVATGMLLRGVIQVGDTLQPSLERLVEAATVAQFKGGVGVYLCR